MLVSNRTSSNLVLHPPSLKESGETPDQPAYDALADRLARQNGYVDQNSHDLYDTSGGTEDWSYYTSGGLGFTFEIGDPELGYHPPYAYVAMHYRSGSLPGGRGNRGAYLEALKAATETDKHSVLSGSGVPGATLRVRKTVDTFTSAIDRGDGTVDPPQTFEDVLESTMTVPASGSFAWHVNPSTRPFARDAHAFVSRSRTRREAFAQPAASGGDHAITVGEDEVGSVLRVDFTAAGDDGYRLTLLRDGDVIAEKDTLPGGRCCPFEHELSAAGEYVLRVEAVAAREGYTGTFEVFDVDRTTTTPAEESWELTCEVGGTAVATRSVQVERGEQLALGDVCS